MGAQSGRSIASDPNWIQRFEECAATLRKESPTMRQNQGRRRLTQPSSVTIATKKRRAPGVPSANIQEDQTVTRKRIGVIGDEQSSWQNTELIVLVMNAWVWQAIYGAEAKIRGMVEIWAYAAVAIVGSGALGAVWIREYWAENRQTARIMTRKAHSKGMSVLERLLPGKEQSEEREGSSRMKPHGTKDAIWHEDREVSMTGRSSPVQQPKQQSLAISSSGVTTPTELTPRSEQLDDGVKSPKMPDKKKYGQFPGPKDYGLPGLFSGRNISSYIENFEDACDDEEVDDYLERIRRWQRWCDVFTRTIVKGFPATSKLSWKAFKVKVFTQWEYLDVRQDEDIKTELRNFYNVKVEDTAIAILQAFGKMEHIISRLPEEAQTQVWADAPGDFWSKLSLELQVELEGRNQEKTEVKDMTYEGFRKWLLATCKKGFFVNGRVQKAAGADVLAVSKTHIVLGHQKEEDDDSDVEEVIDGLEDLTTQFAELKIKRQALSAPAKKKLESLRLGNSVRMNSQEIEEVSTYLQRYDNSNGGYGQKRTGGQTGQVAFKIDARTGSSSKFSQCYYCGLRDGHVLFDCPDNKMDYQAGLFWRLKNEWYMGRRDSAPPFFQISAFEVRRAERAGKMGDLIRAYASQMPQHECHEGYLTWKDHHEKKTGESFVPDLTLIEDLSIFKPLQEESVRTSLNRLGVLDEEKKEKSMFDYMEAKALNFYTDRRGQQTFVHRVTRKTDEQVKDAEEAAILAQEAPLSKRIRVEEEGPVEENAGMTGTSEGDTQIGQNRRTILTPAVSRKPAPEHQDTTIEKPDGGRTTLKSSEKKTSDRPKPADNTVSELRQLVERTMGVKAAVTLEDLVRVSPEYKGALIAYITQLSSGMEIIDYKGSSVPGKDSARTAPKEGEGIPRSVRTNMNRVSVPATGVRSTVPALFGITSDGEYGVATGGFWERLLLGASPSKPQEQAVKLMKTPIHLLSLKQKAELGVVTRTHALPSLYCNFENGLSEKELALLDSGSECNALSLRIAQKYGLAVQTTNVVSKGLHQSKRFEGETQARVFLAGRSVLVHFFVLADDVGGHDLLLGMPFFKDTNLTFDFKDGRLVTANVTMDNMIIKAHVVSDEMARRHAVREED